MNGNIKKLITTMSSIGELPKKIIIHGIQLACGLLLIALILYYFNNDSSNFTYTLDVITFSTAKTGLTIFAEAIIGGLLVDYLTKKI